MQRCRVITKKGERCRRTIASGYYKCGMHKDAAYTYECGIFPLEIWDIIYKNLSPSSLGNVMLSSFIHYYRISNEWLAKNPYYSYGAVLGIINGWKWSSDDGKYKISYDSAGEAIFFKDGITYPRSLCQITNARSISNIILKIDCGSALTHVLNKKLTQSYFTRDAPPSDKQVEMFIKNSIINKITHIIMGSRPGITIYSHKTTNNGIPIRYINMNQHRELAKKIAKKLKEVDPNIFVNITTGGDLVYCKGGITSL